MISIFGGFRGSDMTGEGRRSVKHESNKCVACEWKCRLCAELVLLRILGFYNAAWSLEFSLYFGVLRISKTLDFHVSQKLFCWEFQTSKGDSIIDYQQDPSQPTTQARFCSSTELPSATSFQLALVQGILAWMLLLSCLVGGLRFQTIRGSRIYLKHGTHMCVVFSINIQTCSWIQPLNRIEMDLVGLYWCGWIEDHTRN